MTRRGDQVGGLGRLRRARRQQRADRLGLHRHQADMVGDHVVQFAGDPDALGGGSGGAPGGRGVEFGLGPLGPACHGGHALAAGPVKRARHPGGAEDERLDDRVVRLGMSGLDLPEGDPRGGGGYGDPADPRAAAVGDGGDRDRGRERQRRVPERERVVEVPRDAAADQRGHRPAAAPGERHALRGGQEEGEPARVHPRLVRQQRQQVEHGEHQRQSGVLHEFPAP
jgi:hypothetical protein